MTLNFWGYMVSGLIGVGDAVANVLPDHMVIGLEVLITGWLSSAPLLLYTIVNQFINLSIPMLVFFAIIVLELVRALLAAWQWIKNAIPFA